MNPLAPISALLLLVALPTQATETPRHPGVAEALASMDLTADPCQDFYQYACGGWLANTQMPADQVRWARSFSVIMEQNREALRTLIEAAAASPGSPGTDRFRVGTFYASCTDEAAIDDAGVEPLRPWLARIDAIDSPAAALRVAGELARFGPDAFLGFAAYPDFKDPNTSIGFVSQDGLGLPNRDYYVSDDPAKQALLAEYRGHVAAMLRLLGDEASAATASADAIVAFETELAKVSRPAEQMREISALYNKVDLAGLEKLAPSLPWKAYFEALGRGDIRDLNVATPEFFERLESLLPATELATLKAYLRWHLIDATAPWLSTPVVEADFGFYGRKLNGQREQPPRWKRCVDATQGAFGEAVGRLYVESRFAGDSKERALVMIDDIKAAFGQALPDLAWMDPATRSGALAKAATLAPKVGYPDTWRDYSKVAIRPGAYFANQVAAASFETDRRLAKVSAPVDRSEWNMPPQMVNAYYNPLWNEIVFPAGILQPPFFHRDFPRAMNYGAIGAVAGHELSHGFDDQGRRFDPQGRLEEWWSPEASARYEEQAACIEKQYSAYELQPGQFVNGKLTLGENIADAGGLKQAWSAYKIAEARSGAEPRALEQISNDQLFFVSFAQAWCAHATPEVERRLLTTDSHAPPRFRAIGAIANNPFFAEVFSCKPDAAMVPAQRCTVW